MNNECWLMNTRQWTNNEQWTVNNEQWMLMIIDNNWQRQMMIDNKWRQLIFDIDYDGWQQWQKLMKITDNLMTTDDRCQLATNKKNWWQLLTIW